jgi:SAM-dependent methyltransferase
LRNRFAVFDEGIVGRFLYHRYPNTALRSLSKINLKTDSHILDIGCGTGSLLYSLSMLGFKNLLGVDPFNERNIEYRNGLRIERKTIHDVYEKWDLIMFHHSFEHLHDPLETLMKVSDLLKPNGSCVIRAPTVSSFAWKQYGINWAQLDAPRHFFLHSVESIELLAKKTGLEFHDTCYDSTPFQFWASEQYKMGIPLEDKQSLPTAQTGSVFTRKEMAVYKRKAEKLNRAKQGDQAAFYLRKT